MTGEWRGLDGGRGPNLCIDESHGMSFLCASLEKFAYTATDDRRTRPTLRFEGIRAGRRLNTLGDYELVT